MKKKELHLNLKVIYIIFQAKQVHHKLKESQWKKEKVRILKQKNKLGKIETMPIIDQFSVLYFPAVDLPRVDEFPSG